MNLKYHVERKRNLKEVLKEEFNISERLWLKLKRNKKIYVNNISCNSYYELKVGDIIEVKLDTEEESDTILPTYMNLAILYEDEELLVVDKPAGIPVHPSQLHYEDSLSNGVRYYFDEIHLHKKIRPVNRLDKDTSGIVIFAKNEYVQEMLIQQMKNQRFSKQYIALVEGKLKEKNSTIILPIARKENSIIERCVSEKGDIAITNYYVIKELENMSFLNISLLTGRTHQIRVHMSYIGHPIVGDTLYGHSSDIIARQALHACKVCFYHPITNQKIEIESNIPKDIETIIFQDILQKR